MRTVQKANNISYTTSMVDVQALFLSIMKCLTSLLTPIPSQRVMVFLFLLVRQTLDNPEHLFYKSLRYPHLTNFISGSLVPQSLSPSPLIGVDLRRLADSLRCF